MKKLELIKKNSKIAQFIFNKSQIVYKLLENFFALIFANFKLFSKLFYCPSNLLKGFVWWNVHYIKAVGCILSFIPNGHILKLEQYRED